MKRRVVLLFTLYGCTVIGLGIREITSSQRALETLLPYSHPYVSETLNESDMRLAASEHTLSETQLVMHSVAMTEETAVETMEAETAAETMVMEADDEPTPTEAITYPLELNTATFEELCTLPGIGEITAQAICDYREVIGGFRSMQQLLEVYGIGEGKYQAILPYLWLEEPIVALDLPEPEPVPIPQEHIPETEPPTDPPEIPVINLNTATIEMLMLLPGCTSEIAENILYLRDVQIHKIYNPLEITMAEGVTDELYLQWEPYLAVDDNGSTQLPLD